jgi:hypothetical protein
MKSGLQELIALSLLAVRSSRSAVAVDLAFTDTSREWIEAYIRSSISNSDLFR